MIGSFYNLLPGISKQSVSRDGAAKVRIYKEPTLRKTLKLFKCLELKLISSSILNVA